MKRKFLLVLFSIATSGILFLIGLYLIPYFQIRPPKAFSLGRISFAKGACIPDARLGWKMRPNLTVIARKPGEQERPLYFTDKYGFRNSPSELPLSGKAILLGDSFVAGHFLSDKETISQQLSKKLGGYVYNFGVGGYSTDQEFIIGMDALEKFQAPWIVLIFFTNDLLFLNEKMAYDLPKPRFKIVNNRVDFKQLERVSEAPDHGTTFEPMPEGPLTAYTDGSEQYETNYRALHQKIYQANLNQLNSFFLHPLSLFKTSYRGLELLDKFGIEAYQNISALHSQWDLAFQFLNRLNAKAEKKDTRLLLFFLPEMAQIQLAQKDLFAPQQSFKERCEQHQLHCLDPHAEFLSESKNGDLYFRDEGHLSPRGAEFTANLIAKYLEQSTAR